jgi:transforming growth factor-beta-induced protein
MKLRNWLGLGLVVASVVACTDTPTATLTPDEASERRAAASPTVVDVALAVNAETGEFSTLIAAVVTAELVDALSAVGQRTVFAPTDAAFAALGLDAGNIGTLPKETLTNILLYHVAPGRRLSGDVVSSDRIRMSNGGFTWISLEGGEAYINDSKIIAVDVEASNGVIHVIDAVLLP